MPNCICITRYMSFQPLHFYKYLIVPSKNYAYIFNHSKDSRGYTLKLDVFEKYFQPVDFNPWSRKPYDYTAT